MKRHCSVVIQSSSPPLEERSDHDSSRFAGYLADCGRRRSGNRLGQVKKVRILTLAEILSAKQFGQTNHICAQARRLADVFDGRREIRLGVRSHPHLNQPNVVFARPRADCM